MKTLFNEAVKDESTCNLDSLQSEARLLLGVKITKIKDTNEVIIQDTARSSFYREITLEEYGVFLTSGFRSGVLSVFESRYARRLDKLNKRYSIEADTKNRARVLGAIDREIDNLADRKQELLNKYGY